MCDPEAQNQALKVNFSKLIFLLHLNINVWFVMIGQYLKMVQKNLNIDKIIFKVV